MSAWEVKSGKVELPSGNLASAACRHRSKGACGGCYARIVFAIEDALAEPSSTECIAKLRSILLIMKLEKD